jgi:muconate cycloisomerase
VSAHLPAATRDLHDLVVEDVRTYAVGLPTKRSFGVAGGAVTVQGRPTLRILVRVTAGGVVGWGEATPIPSWTYETAESIYSTIDRYLGPALIGRSAWDLDATSRLFDRVINRGLSIGAPLAKAAVDMALNDVLGRALDIPVGVLWGARRCEEVELGWVVSGQTADEVGEAVREGLDLGFRSFKVKVGLHDEKADLDVVEGVRDAAPDGAFLWVDANQGYTVDTALRLARKLHDLDVAAFEQPLPANDIAGLRRLRDASPVPIALDESVRAPSDLATLVRLDAVDVVIAKVQRSGGLTLSRRVCALAEDCGLRLMGSGLTDSDLGLAASLHLFSAFGISGPVDLNGRQFIESPYTTRTVEVKDGIAQVPLGPGLGVDVDEAAVQSLAVDLW